MAGTRGTILVVDDEPAEVGLIADYLESKQLAVARAHTLEEALAELAHARPDAVLLSLALADMDGLEALRRIRQYNVEVGIVVVTDPADTTRAKEALTLGALDYVLTPIDFDFLNRAIEKALEAGAAVPEFGPSAADAPSASPQALLYTLALEVFRATRPLAPEARASVGTALEQAALSAMQRGVGGEKTEVIRALNQLRTMIHFARDLGDLGEDVSQSLDELVNRARRSVGLS
jgi:DNA-binding response OmpR family regulator